MKVAIIVVVVLLIAVAVVRLRSRRAIVLGAQYAAAEARDRDHRAKFGHLRSAFAHLSYDPSASSLIDPRVSDVDNELRSLCARFAASSPDEQRDFRNGATGDDFYTLLHFARRSSVFALRDRDEKWVRDALLAVALIDAARVDERDVPLTLSLVHHTAERLALRPQEMFDAAAQLAELRTAEILRSFVRQRAADKDIQKAWGFQEVQVAGAPGFVQRGFDAYQPSRNLLGAALTVRNAVDTDRYDADVMLASTLPPIWFPKETREQAERILARCPAGASVTGTLHKNEHERADVQTFIVFLVEAPSDDDAATLERLAESQATGTATLAVHHGRLFALTVARAFEVGAKSYETTESIRRFEAPFKAALEQAGG